MVASRKIRLIMELRRAGIADTEVLSAIERIPRDAFTPESFRHQAYENMAIPIGQGQTLSQPQVVALMTQALRASRRTKVLEVGTGCGHYPDLFPDEVESVFSGLGGDDSSENYFSLNFRQEP